MKRLIASQLLLVLLLSSNILSCSLTTDITDNEPGFGIYLLDTGELVLSDNHINAYYRDAYLYENIEETTHAIELNEEGIERWNSYNYHEEIPKLKDSLYGRNFVLKIEGEEIYRGEFYSMVSSASYDRIVILDAIVELNKEHNRIYINNGYPNSAFASGEDPRNNQAVLEYLNKKGLLK